jgi:hypothetical protein
MHAYLLGCPMAESVLSTLEDIIGHVLPTTGGEQLKSKGFVNIKKVFPTSIPALISFLQLTFVLLL